MIPGDCGESGTTDPKIMLGLFGYRYVAIGLMRIQRDFC